MENERLAKTEQRLDNHDDDIRELKSQTAILTGMQITMERQAVQIENNTKQMEKFTVVLDKVNDNISLLNENQMNLNKNQELMKQDLNNLSYKIQEVEDNQKVTSQELDEEKENNKLDIREISKKIVFTAITIFVGYLLAQWGIK